MRVRMPWLLTAGLFAVFAPSLPAAGEKYIFFENFEDVAAPAFPTGWTTLDGNADGAKWETRPFGGARGGPCPRYLSDTSNTATDWFFTPAIPLAAGTTYTLSIQDRVTTSALAHRLAAFVGSAPAVLAMNSLIFNRPNTANAVLQQTTGTFTVGASGNYYIGFQCTSDPANLALIVDDVLISIPAADLQVQLQLTKGFYTPGANRYGTTEPIECLVMVKNVGALPVTVNGLLTVGHEPDPDSVLSFTVTNSLGAAVPFRAKVKPAPPESGDFRSLAPGAIVSKYYDLNAGPFDFTAPGAYTIRAVYKNLYGAGALPVWRGKIVSAPVGIIIQ